MTFSTLCLRTTNRTGSGREGLKHVKPCLDASQSFHNLVFFYYRRYVLPGECYKHLKGFKNLGTASLRVVRTVTGSGIPNHTIYVTHYLCFIVSRSHAQYVCPVFRGFKVFGLINSPGTADSWGRNRNFFLYQCCRL